jgi:hypothetical protein
MRKYLLRSPMFTENEKEEFVNDAIKDEIIKVLEHNNYFLTSDKCYTKIVSFGSIKVTIEDVTSYSFAVEMSCIMPGMHGSGMVTVQVKELFDNKVCDEYSMYEEHTPEEIMLHMMNDFYTRAFFMNAISNGKNVCVCEESNIPTALSTVVPF